MPLCQRSSKNMGQNRVELLTPALSEQCSNRLSYWPISHYANAGRQWLAQRIAIKKGKGRKSPRIRVEFGLMAVGLRPTVFWLFAQIQRFELQFSQSKFASQKTVITKTRQRYCSPFKVKGGDPAALSSTATLLRLHPPH